VGFQVTEVQKALKGFDYPGGSDDLARHAEGNGADSELVEALRGLKKDDGFDGPNAVMHELKEQADALGGPTPGGRTQRETKDVQGPAFQVTEVQKALKGADYPMDGRQLADLARSNGGSDELVEALRGLRQVEGPNGVMKELKEHLGGPTGGSDSS
jgi:hypothetical protein